MRQQPLVLARSTCVPASEPTSPIPTGPSGAPPSFRPAPVLAIAVAADGGADAAAVGRLRAEAGRLFEALHREAVRVAAMAPDLFAEEQPALRVVTRFSGEADLALAEAARAVGAEVRAVLPWRRDGAHSGSAHPIETEAPLDLDGEPGDPLALGLAGDVLLDRCDILVAAWDGRPDPSPGSTAALVQRAVERRLPVLLLPREGEDGVSVIDDPDDHLLPVDACRLPRVALADNLDRVVARAFAPPASEAERQALRDCMREPPSPRSRRPEYRVLLALAAKASRDGGGMSAAEEWARARAVAARVSAGAAAELDRLAALQARLETLAAFYGQRARSGSVLRYFMPVVGGFFIALLAVLVPQYSLAWLGVQAVVMTLLVSESSWGARRRWSERWLDYRSLAERIRCDRFLTPFGIETGRIEDEAGTGDPAWMRWCHRRLGRSRWTGGRISPEVAAAALDHLVGVEIPGQIRYHEDAALRYRSLGTRLRLTATASVAIMLAASLVLLAVPSGGGLFAAVTTLLLSLLIILPSLFLAARGLRAEAGFELAAARSSEARQALARLAGRIGRGPPGYERLVQASLAAARAMIQDTADWRVGLQRSRQPYRTGVETEAHRGAIPAMEGAERATARREKDDP